MAGEEGEIGVHHTADQAGLAVQPIPAGESACNPKGHTTKVQ